MLSEWGLNPEAAPQITTPLTCATNGHFKLLARGDDDRVLYDLDRTPWKTQPLPVDAARSEIVARLEPLVREASPARVAGEPR